MNASDEGVALLLCCAVVVMDSMCGDLLSTRVLA